MATTLTNTRYVDLQRFGLLKISGTQSAEFLQGQLSCDVAEVTPIQSRLGVHCNAKGRVLATFRLFYQDPDYYLLLPYGMAPLLLKDLYKYSVFYKVTLEDKSDFFQKIGCIGTNITQDLINYVPHFKLESNGVYTKEQVTLLVLPGVMQRAILLSPPNIVHFDQPLEFIDVSFWDMIDIESNMVSIYPQTRAMFTPHHLSYHQRGGISFSKGCYTGQEVIARMHYLGRLTKQVYQFELSRQGVYSSGVDITDSHGNIQGTLIMFSHCKATSSYKALGILQDNAVAESLYCQGALLENIKISR